ncbi:MAG: VWA domain-containing protein [Acidobacteriota bacterium]
MSRSVFHPLALVTFTLALGAASESAATPAETQPRFGGERTDVVAVEIPLQVVRDGQPVRGLSQADFAIYDGKKKQPITGFEVIDLAATPPPSAAGAPPPIVSPAARRHFLILFDLANSEPKSIIKARAAVQKVVDRLYPSDVVAVATHSPSTGPKILVGFTSDRKQIAAAIATLGKPELTKRSGDPLNLILDTQYGSGSGAIELPPESDDPRQRPALIALEEFLADTRDNIRRNQEDDRRYEAQRLTDYTRALSDLATLMASVEGRKYVVLLSEGFDSSLVLGSTNEAERAEQQTAAEQGEIWKVDSNARFGNTKSANDLEGLLEAMRRSDCVIQAVDIGGLREGGEGFSRPSGQDGLFAMADQTGGELYRNFNDLAEAMAKMLERTSVTYVLSFQPTVARDGAYHKVRVELAKPARGTRISHRDGYFAPKPFDPRDAQAHLFDAAELITNGRAGGPLAASLVAVPFPGATEQKAYVPVVVEIDGASLIAAAESGPLPTEIYAYALAADGSIGDFFGQTLGLDLAKVKDKLLQNGLKYYGHLELPPGDWSLRVLVRNGRNGDSGLTVLPLNVPRFAPATPTLLRPFFLESPSSWLMVREKPRGDQADEPYPFMVQKQMFVPASRPILTAEQTTSLSLVAYHLAAGAAGDLSATARVSDAAGKAVPGGEARLLGREAQGNDREALVVSFKPAGLSPGQYRLSLHLAATGDVAGIDSTTVPFEVQ